MITSEYAPGFIAYLSCLFTIHWILPLNILNCLCLVVVTCDMSLKALSTISMQYKLWYQRLFNTKKGVGFSLNLAQQKHSDHRICPLICVKSKRF